MQKGIDGQHLNEDGSAQYVMINEDGKTYRAINMNPYETETLHNGYGIYKRLKKQYHVVKHGYIYAMETSEERCKRAIDESYDETVHFGIEHRRFVAMSERISMYKEQENGNPNR